MHCVLRWKVNYLQLHRWVAIVLIPDKRGSMITHQLQRDRFLLSCSLLWSTATTSRVIVPWSSRSEREKLWNANSSCSSGIRTNGCWNTVGLDFPCAFRSRSFALLLLFIPRVPFLLFLQLPPTSDHHLILATSLIPSLPVYHQQSSTARNATKKEAPGKNSQSRDKRQPPS